MLPLSRWPQVPPETAKSASVGQRLSADLAWWIATLQDFHDSIEDSYNTRALKALENYLYSVGSWFNKIKSINKHPYESWINRSEQCQNQIKDIIDKAGLAAYNFQQAREKYYNRSMCKRSVEDLIYAIQNLKSLNDQRIGGAKP